MCDLKIDLIMFGSPYVKFLFFCFEPQLFDILHIIGNFGYLFWTLFDILIHELLLKPPQNGTGLFFLSYSIFQCTYIHCFSVPLLPSHF